LARAVTKRVNYNGSNISVSITEIPNEVITPEQRKRKLILVPVCP
jgi:hypothetical protein